MRYISAVVLLSCVAMSAAFGAELSGDQVATDNGVLKGIDIAFLPMNLPPTMSVAKAADAIREFKPKIVYPYHYRSGDKTKADMEELKRLVGKDSGVEIRVRDWYPEEPIHDSVAERVAILLWHTTKRNRPSTGELPSRVANRDHGD